MTALNSPLDTYTLQCIECHDDKIRMGVNFVVAKKWQHGSSSRLKHAIGMSYVNISSIKPNKFNPPSMLSPEIRLVQDKIGCGTCHNACSNNKEMLVMSNARSRLCLECHIK